MSEPSPETRQAELAPPAGGRPQRRPAHVDPAVIAGDAIGLFLEELERIAVSVQATAAEVESCKAKAIIEVVEGVEAVLPSAHDPWYPVGVLLRSAVLADGGHHKQWYLEQIATALEITLPEHDPGVSP